MNSIIESLIISYLANTMDKKYTSNIKSNIITGVYLGIYLLMFLITPPENIKVIYYSLAPLIYITLIAYYKHKMSIKEGLSIAFVFVIFYIIIQTIFVSLLGISLLSLGIVFSTLLIGSHLLKGKLVKQIKNFYRKEHNFLNDRKKFILLSLFQFIFLLITAGYLAHTTNLKENRFLLVMVNIVIFAYIVHIFYSLRGFINAELKSEMLESYQKSYNQEIQDLSEFWHSYANLNQVIYSIVNSDIEDINLIKSSLEDMLDRNEISRLRNKLEIVSTGDPIISGILSIKQIYAEELGVNLEINNTIDYQIINKNSLNISELITNFLDNAIEAAYFADKEVTVNIFTKNNNYYISIVNKFKEEKGKVLKYGNSRGLGLSRNKSIVKKIKDISYSTHINANMYKVIIKGTLNLNNKEED